MEWTDEKLLELRNLGAVAFSLKKAAQVMEVDFDDLKKDYATNANVKASYDAGVLESEVKLNKGIMDAAAAGSSPAQVLALKLLEYCKNENEL